jgi:hypothetical protein
VVFVQAVGREQVIYDSAIRLTNVGAKSFSGYLHSEVEKLSPERFGEFELHYQVFEAGKWEIPVETYTYEIVSGNETGAFAVDAESGNIKIADQAQIDYELGINQFVFTVRVTDGMGNQFDTQVTVNINDINDSLNNDAQALLGLNEHDWTGWSVAPAGDINGDSFDDIIVGAPQADANGLDSGMAYVLFSDASGTFPTLDQVEIEGRGFAIIGAAEGDNAGFAVAGGVDINGDGLSDVVIGAPYADVNGEQSGSTYVVFGKTDAQAVSLASFETTSPTNGSVHQGFAMHGAYSQDFSGGTLVVGDVNGDGLGDIIIGETVNRVLAGTGNYDTGSLFDDPYADPHMAYVVYGKNDGNALNLADVALDENTNGFAITKSNRTNFQEWQYGAQVLPTGDFNSDGLTDFIVSRGLYDENNGTSYVVYGRIGGEAIHYNDIKTDKQGIKIVPENGFYAFDFGDAVLNALPSFTTSNIGDVNADGVDDIALLLTDSGCCSNVDYPRAYVIFGGVSVANEILLSDIANGNGGFVIHNDASNIEYHDLQVIVGSIGGAGDLNGDGFDDIIIGDPFAEDKKGRVYAVYGREGTEPVYLSEVIETEQGFYSEGNGSAQLGQMIASAGDVNADGIKDIQFGVPSANTTFNETQLSNSGAVYVLHGDGKLVTHWGTSGDDAISSDSNDNNIATGAGDDTVTSAGGSDAIYTGPGDDIISIASVDFVRIDGGGGTDAIKLTGSDMFLNLADMSAKVRSIEVFDIRGTGANALSINKSASGNSNIRVIGDADDSVYAGNNQWQDTGSTRVIDNVAYRVYQVGNAEMLVQVGVTTEINNVPTIADQTFSIVESARGGASVGHVLAESNDIGDFVSYAIVGNSIFNIDILTGELTIDASVAGLDYETTSSYTLTVQVTDTYGAVAAATITVNVTDVQSVVHSFDGEFTGAHGAFGSSAVLDLLGFNTMDLEGFELVEGQSDINGGLKIYKTKLSHMLHRDPLFYYEVSGQISLQPTFIAQGSGVDVDMPITMDLAYADEIQVGQETLITTQFKLDKEANFLANSPGFYFDAAVGFHEFYHGIGSPLFDKEYSTKTDADTVFGLSSVGLQPEATSIGVRSQMCSESFVYSEVLDYIQGMSVDDQVAFVEYVGGLDDTDTSDGSEPISGIDTSNVAALTYVHELDEAALAQLMRDFDFKAFFGNDRAFDARCLTQDYSEVNSLAVRATIDDPNWYTEEVYWGQHAYQWLAPYTLEQYNKDVEQCVLNYFSAVGGDDLYTTQSTTIIDTFISARVKLEQYFHIDIRPVATLTLEDGTELVFPAEEDIRFTPEISQDVNNDGIIDANLTVDVKAVFGNDSYFYPELYSPMKVGMFEYEQQEANCETNPTYEYGQSGRQYMYESFGPVFDREVSYKIAVNVMGDEVERGFAHLLLPSEDGELTGEFTEVDIAESLIEADDTAFTEPDWDRSVHDILHPDGTQLDRKSELEFVISKQTFSKAISFDLCSNAGTCGEPILSYKNNAPVASNIQFSGEFTAKQTVTASYDYTDYENDAEGDTVLQWYRASDDQGTNVALIDGESDISYTLQAIDVDNFVRFCVKPHDGSVFGTGVCSSWEQVASPFYSDLSVPTGFGQALVFDGIAQSILQENYGAFSTDQGAFTIEAWLNVTQYNASSHNNILTLTQDGLGRAAIRVLDDGRIRVKVSDNEFYSTSVIQLDKWHHVAISYDNSTQQLDVYVDGTQVISEVDTSTFGAADFVWGANKNQGNSLFNGKLDEIRVWQTARSAQDIQRGMNAGVSPNHPDLFSYIDFEGGGIDTVTERVSLTDLYTQADTVFEKHLAYASLDGAHDYIEIPHDDYFKFKEQDFTVQAWIYVTGNGNYNRPIVFKRNRQNTSRGWGLRLNSSEKLQFYYTDSPNNKTLTSDQELVNKNWYHVAVSVDHTENLASMYINGVFEKSVSISNFDDVGNSLPLRIGQYSAGGNFYETFKGYIDDVAIWERALTSTQIQTCMQSMQAECASDLIALYDFDDGTVDNKAQNKYHGSVNSGATIREEMPVTYYADRNETLYASIPVGDGVMFEVTQGPSEGVLYLNEYTGEFDYTPHSDGTSGSDTFSYIIYNNNDGISATRTVTIVIE